MKVSILLPVYNSEGYLKATIDSLLAQTLQSFELIVINDGSTDGSAEIIRSYKDSRIVYVENEGNRGLIYTLNRGIEMARGEYLARMDADDVCMPARLELQSRWLDEHPGTGLVACFIDFIDREGKPGGVWELDRKTVSHKAIRSRMPGENCLAHPSVMGRTELFRKFRYNPEQKHIEDYDLWLRMLGEGCVVEKLPEALLLYRLHPQSVTHTKLKKTNFFLKHFHCKRKYLRGRIRKGKFNMFDLRVTFEMVADLVKALLKSIKRRLLK
jgi:glycosyltransferase involved in cell wall biosynthesis